VLLSSCALDSSASLWLDPPGWSRGQYLGVTESTNIIPMCLDPQGNLYAGFFSAGESGGLTLYKFNKEGEIDWRTIETAERIASGRELKLVWHGGALNAFWIDYGDLLFARVEDESGQLGAFEVLVEDLAVQDYSVVVSPNGDRIVAFSGSTNDPGIYFLEEPDLDDPMLIDADGVRPQLALDAYSNLHSAWMYEPPMLGDAELRYAVFPEAAIQHRAHIYRFSTKYRSSDDVEGPFLGVDLTHVYLGDTAMIRTGLREGEVETGYRAFPIWDVQNSVVPIRLFVPTEFEFRYQAASPENGLQIGQRVKWDQLRRDSDQIMEVVSTGSNRSETAFAFHERVSTRSGQSQAQIGLITLGAGEPRGYQLITFTSTGSRRPNLLISDEGYTFMSWLELSDVRTYSVYLATTMPPMKSGFDALGIQEWQSMLGNMAFGMFSGLVLFPVAFLWMIPPLIVIASLSFLRRKEDRITQPANVISLLIALVLFQLVKVGVFPSLKTTIPFVGWIPVIPVIWYRWLQILVPTVIALISMLIAVVTIRRRSQPSPTVAFIIYALCDGILTLAVYGGFLFGM
jgi:hypothetical protein